MNFVFRLLLTFNSTSLLVIVFLVQKGCTLKYFFPSFAWLDEIPEWSSYVLYILIPIFLTFISIIVSPLLGKDEFKENEVTCVEYANNSFLPSYLGYFFVALSVGNWTTLGFVYGVLFVFTFLSQALYFNPLFLVFGFEFYNIKNRDGATMFLISRKRYRAPSEIVIESVNRINNYTFIERA